MSDAVAISPRPGGCAFAVRVVPGASRDQVAGVADGALRVRVSAPPVEGAANDRLVRFLAKDLLGVPRSAVRIESGERGRSKVIFVQADEAVVRAAVDGAVSRAAGPPPTARS